ncbi:MAG: hypothetical protein R3200_07390 [Xanthomonadales bacterium]|nr:hypothetical protein [Xanthomonadales bacterium]
MARTRFIEHKGHKIVFMDFARIESIEAGVQYAKEAQEFVAAQPKKKHLLTLVDVSDSPFNRQITDALSKLSSHNKPYVIANATVGVTGLKGTLLKTISRLTGRNLKAFDDVDEAKDWLVEEGKKFAESGDED